MSEEHYVDQLFLNLGEMEKQEIVSAAEILDDRPPVLRGRGGTPQLATEWMELHRSAIVPVLFRVVNPDDDEIAYMVRDRDFLVPESATFKSTPFRGEMTEMC